MRPHPGHTCGLFTYPIPGTSPRGGADDNTRMAASFGGNGAAPRGWRARLLSCGGCLVLLKAVQCSGYPSGSATAWKPS